MQCFPLYSVLLALDNPLVNYFSLDIEGAELPVLKTIPFDKTQFDVIGVEIKHAGDVFEGSEEHIMAHLKKNGYNFAEKSGHDALFVRKLK